MSMVWLSERRGMWRREAPVAAKFIAVGAFNTALTLLVIVLLKAYGDAPDLLANLCGYLVGLASSFALNRRWTFGQSVYPAHTAARFLVTFAFSYLLNAALVSGLLNLGVSAYPAHLAGMPFYTLAFYLGCRNYVFAASPMPPRARAALRSFPWVWFAGALAVGGVSLFYQLGSLPIQVWDESRLANSALEMARSGFSLAPTFDGVVDHWNTKPPLMIWLMAASIRWLGPNEWGVRLPSALAGLATVALMFVFVASRVRKAQVGFVAVLTLLMTVYYVNFHGARTGDYDALLTLWTTAYLILGYLYVHGKEKHRALWLAACTVAIALAFLTKTVQGLIFLPALVAYAVWQRGWLQMARSPAVYVSLACVVLACTGYYLAREAVDPGYFAAVQANDIQGRFATTLENHYTGPFFYLVGYQAFQPTLPGLLAFGYLLLRGQGERRRLGVFLGLMSSFYLVVISLAKTQTLWYSMPIFPLTAVLMAQGLDSLQALAISRNKGGGIRVMRKRMTWAVISIGVVMTAYSVVLVEYRKDPASMDIPDLTSLALREPRLRQTAITNIAVLQRGNEDAQGTFYAPSSMFYANTLRADGRSIEILPVSAPIPAQAQGVLTCDAAVRVALARQSKATLTFETSYGCGLYEFSAR